MEETKKLIINRRRWSDKNNNKLNHSHNNFLEIEKLVGKMMDVEIKTSGSLEKFKEAQQFAEKEIKKVELKKSINTQWKLVPIDASELQSDLEILDININGEKLNNEIVLKIYKEMVNVIPAPSFLSISSELPRRERRGF